MQGRPAASVIREESVFTRQRGEGTADQSREGVSLGLVWRAVQGRAGPGQGPGVDTRALPGCSSGATGGSEARGRRADEGLLASL